MSFPIYKYARAALNAYRGNITDLSDVDTEIHLALMGDSFDFDQNADDSWADVSEHEIDPGENPPYAEYGKEIENLSWEMDGNLAVLDGDNVTWEDSEITARWGVIFDNTPGDDADKKLLAVLDFEEEKSTAGGPFEIQWHEDGILAVEAIAT